MCLANSRHSINAGLIIIPTDQRFSIRGHPSPREHWAVSGWGRLLASSRWGWGYAQRPMVPRMTPQERPGPDVTSAEVGMGVGLLKINHSPHYHFIFALQRWKRGLREVQRLVQGHTVSQDWVTRRPHPLSTGELCDFEPLALPLRASACSSGRWR